MIKIKDDKKGRFQSVEAEATFEGLQSFYAVGYGATEKEALNILLNQLEFLT